jgi:FlaA1/EpsC-like NDP-sugar epimerase
MQTSDMSRFTRIPAVCLTNLRNRHLLVSDIGAILLAPALALMLSVGQPAAVHAHLHSLTLYTLLAIGVRIPLFYVAGLYRRYWRYATVDEVSQILATVIASSLCIDSLLIAASVFAGHGPTVPPSFPILECMVTLAAVGGTRFSIRLAQSGLRHSPATSARRVLIVGAGNAGQRLLADIRNTPQLNLLPVGFIDDNPRLHGLRIHNLQVYGGQADLVATVREQRIDQVIIAIPSAPGKAIRSYVQLCQEAKVPTKTIPSIPAILEDRVRVNELRTVEIEDLLHRAPILTDIEAVRHLLSGKSVLITGAGGSIGSELCRQALRCGPAHLGILGHGENSIFEINNELLQLKNTAVNSQYPSAAMAQETTVTPFIADIRDADRLKQIVAEFEPDIIFHAAAHKHVPLMEANPTEALANNVLGTRNLVKAALAAGVHHLVMISTDKAVNPMSVMGASKRAAELVVLNAARRTGRHYVVVRFGNVLGSRGSVVPTFKRQIAKGGPVTVSHPEMTRYFMTIPEAVQLVLHASVLGQGGDVFMLDMGNPVKIVDLARDLIELSGLEVGRDIDIRFTGVRPGEKLYEELFVPGERYERTANDKILWVVNAAANIPVTLEQELTRIEAAVAQGYRYDVLRCLRSLIPEFRPDEDRRPLSGRIEPPLGAVREPVHTVPVKASTRSFA